MQFPFPNQQHQSSAFQVGTVFETKQITHLWIDNWNGRIWSLDRQRGTRRLLLPSWSVVNAANSKLRLLCLGVKVHSATANLHRWARLGHHLWGW